MAGDADKISYLQRLAGMCLTGDISSRAFPIFHGAGKNGKSVFLNMMIDLLGDYGSTAPPNHLAQKKYESHLTEIASLKGLRMVVASETKSNMELRCDLVKAVTGGGKMTARLMRGDLFTFNITHKTILETQNLPRIYEISDGIWDRVHLLEWGVRIPDDQQDTHLPEKLKAEGPGILNWMIAGCLAWQSDDNLIQPDCVKLATQYYRDDENPLGDFLREVCVIDENHYIPTRELRTNYERWSDENGRKLMANRTFKAHLRGLGLTADVVRRVGTSTVKCWAGIDLK